MNTEDAVADDILRTCDVLDEVIKSLQDLKSSLGPLYEELDRAPSLEQELEDVHYAKDVLKEQSQALWNANFTLTSAAKRIDRTKEWRTKTNIGARTKKL